VTAFTGLAARIDLALAEADLLLPRIATLVHRAAREDDFAVIDSLALNLQSVYTGLEQVFESIAREVDGGVPEGPNWHRDLLAQMAGSTGSGRPAVISIASYACLDSVRSFRHVVRNVYTYRLDPHRVTELATEVIECYATVRSELREFGTMLAGVE
jgi:hypothetical protein